MRSCLALLTGNLCLLLLILQLSSLQAAADRSARQHPADYLQILRLTADLHQTLELDRRQNLEPRPILAERIDIPCLLPVQYTTGSNVVTAVCISAGFVELMHHLSHAMAWDPVQRGLLHRYLTQLGVQEQDLTLQPVRGQLSSSIQTHNRQATQFSQMAGTLIAIDLAYHYLGYSEKYAAQLRTAPATPIATLLTPREWRQAVLHGAHHALKCGLGVQGIKDFYQSIADMPLRPTWTRYFLPGNADVRKINTDLDNLEEYFFGKRKFINY